MAVAHPFHRALEAVSSFPYPTVAAVNGHCLGGGLELALCCDLRIAGRDARLGMPPAKLGLITRYRGKDQLQIDVSLEQKRGLVRAAANEELRYQQWRLLGSADEIRPPRESIREIRYWGATVHFPAYPAPPGWTTVFRGLVGVYDVATQTVRVAHGTLQPKGRTGEFEQVDLILGGFEAPEVRLFFAPNPRMTPSKAELVELRGRYEQGDRDSNGDLIGRFVLESGQPLPWRAATLIEVSEYGEPAVWSFIGPIALW
jgi:hypothetical protein